LFGCGVCPCVVVIVVYFGDVVLGVAGGFFATVVFGVVVFYVDVAMSVYGYVVVVVVVVVFIGFDVVAVCVVVVFGCCCGCFHLLLYCYYCRW